MGVQVAAVDTRIREELGEDGVRLVMQSMRAADCRTCGRPLGGEVPALVVEDAVTVVSATLHHQRCRPSAWVGQGVINVARFPIVSSACLGLVVQAAGGKESRAALLVNPRLDMLLLEGSPFSRGQDNPGAALRDAGLHSPIESLLDVSMPIPGATAQLRGGRIVVSLPGSPPQEYAVGANAQLRGGEIVVSLPGSPPQEYAAGVNAPFKAALNAHQGLVLFITHAPNPPELTSMAQLAPVLAGNRSTGGWVPL